jgi:hypothetical protein
LLLALHEFYKLKGEAVLDHPRPFEWEKSRRKNNKEKEFFPRMELSKEAAEVARAMNNANRLQHLGMLQMRT